MIESAEQTAGAHSLRVPYAPVDDAIDVVALEVSGSIPSESGATVLRDDPNPTFAPYGEHHLFDADGRDLRWILIENCHLFHFMNACSTGEQNVLDGCRITRMDLGTDSVSAPTPEESGCFLTCFTIDLEPGGSMGEPLLTADPGSSDEDAGWVPAHVHEGPCGTSQALTLDATDAGSGPIAKIHMPRRAPFSFHGSRISMR